MELKKEGFKGQKSIVLPQFILRQIQNNHITSTLYVTDIGLYPKAQNHYRERKKGSEQHILIYCTEGKGWIDIENEHFILTQNQFILLPAGKAHRYGADKINPWTIYWLHFSGTSANLLMPDSPKVKYINLIDNIRNERCVKLFEELYQNLSMGFTQENLEYATTHLWFLLGSFVYRTQQERIRAIEQSDIIEKSIHYMHEHVEGKLKLTELASYCGLSVSHFSLVFSKKTSLSPIAYFINLKIQHACQLLAYTTKNNKEIATLLSFDDPFYFSRTFKKVMGMAPLEYRKSLVK